MNHAHNRPLSEEESMLLSGYVLGDLSEEEMTRLEALMIKNPDLIEELHALQASFELLPQALEIEPAPERILEKIMAQPAPPAKVKTSSGQSRGWLKGLIGLGAIAVSLLGADNLRLRYQLSSIQEKKPERIAALLQHPKSRLISLTSDDSEASGTLLFTKGRWQEVVVSLGNLPPLPPDEIYRLWLGLENGQVIYCGEFNTKQNGTVQVRLTPEQTPPTGVKATELFVTRTAMGSKLDSSSERVLQGAI